MRWLFSPSLAAFAAVASLAPAAARAERFRYHFRPGQVLQSRVSMAGAAMVGATGGQMTRMQFQSVSRQTERVVAVNGGVVTIELKDTPVSGRTTIGGQTQPAKRSATVSTIRLTERGKFLSRKSAQKEGADDGSPGLDGLDVAYGLNFPDRDLKPGDTWEGSLRIPGDPNPRVVSATWKYLGHVTFRGRDCIHVSAVVSMQPDAAGAGVTVKDHMLATITTYFDPKEGAEVYSSGSVVLVTRADLSSISADSGDLASVTKINVVQSALPGRTGRTGRK